MILALMHKQLSINSLKEIMQHTTKISCMVFAILIGAALFSLTFRGFQGDEIISEFLNGLSGGLFTTMLVTMIVMFLLGFFLDFIEIIFVVVPIIAPILLAMGADPVWLAIMIAINLQTSFLTPPFGFALFYLRGVVPGSILGPEVEGELMADFWIDNNHLIRKQFLEGLVVGSGDLLDLPEVQEFAMDSTRNPIASQWFNWVRPP